MSRNRFVMKCLSCGAPVVDSRKCCPYCSAPLRADALGPGVRSEKHGHVIIDDAHVVVGAEVGEHRTCPFCGATTAAARELCSHCGARIVIKTLFLRSLTIEKGGSMTIFSGGSVTIGRPDPAPRLSEAATQGDLEKVKARLNAGDELDAVDAKKRTPLMLALINKHDDVARYFIAMGADLDVEDIDGRTARDFASPELADVIARA